MEGEGGVHGVIILGRRRSGGAYTAEDIAFLHAIAQMSVLALHSSRANQTMAQLDAELKMKMDRIAEQQRQMAVLRAELTSLQRDAGQAPVVASEQDFDREGIRGSSTALLTVLSQVKKVARSSSTVLIRGESGTGKELLARVIHRNSDRAAENLVCVNCAALSSSLLESELFGHVKGAYTGAHIDKAGRFMAADKGTLFLDEIGDISAETQVKLLRVLQERCFEAVGSDKTIHVDVRVIAATNRNLEDMIARGQFRADLFYRLNVVVSDAAAAARTSGRSRRTGILLPQPVRSEDEESRFGRSIRMHWPQLKRTRGRETFANWKMSLNGRSFWPTAT